MLAIALDLLLLCPKGFHRRALACFHPGNHLKFEMCMTIWGQTFPSDADRTDGCSSRPRHRGKGGASGTTSVTVTLGNEVVPSGGTIYITTTREILAFFELSDSEIMNGRAERIMIRSSEITPLYCASAHSQSGSVISGHGKQLWVILVLPSNTDFEL